MFRWSIRTKLLVGLGLLLVIVVTLSWGGIHGLYAYRSLVRSLSRRVSELPLANEFAQSVGNLRVALSQTRTLRDLHTAGRDDSLLGVQLARAEFHTCLSDVEDDLERYRQRLADNPDRIGRISDSSAEWITFGQIQDSLLRIRAANQDKDWLLNEVQVGRLTLELNRLQKLSAELPSHLHRNIREFTEDSKVQYRTLIVLAWITSVTTGLMVALLLILFYQWIFRPLRVLIQGSRKVAAGMFQYRIRLDTQDEMSELANAMNDMTARFQAIRDDLDRQVQERTRQVVRSEQLASVGFLAAGVAHEINNPLASIAMCAESLEGRLQSSLQLGEEQSVVGDYLRMIQTEAFRCKEITEKLLDFSRLGEVKRAPADLRELVQGVIDMIGHLDTYHERHVEFHAGQPVVVNVNPQEIKQVVLNLLTNALDSLDPGGTVSVQVREVGSEAELTFTDNGCGMTHEVLEHLFKPFFTRRRGGQGTGLGLSIVDRIVADHEGAIEAHSDGPGRGSRFRVRLPLVHSIEEKEHRYQAA